MLFIALFTLLSSVVFANKCCEKELAGIAYSVSTTEKEYLTRISRELQNIADIWKTPLGPSLVESFSRKYTAIVAIVDAFGTLNFYELGNYIGQTVPTDRNNVYSYRDARSVMNLGAYANEEIVIVYSFLSFGRDGSVYEVTIGVLKDF
jgi:hypothetical protein